MVPAGFFSILLARCAASILIQVESKWIQYEAGCRGTLRDIHRDSLAKPNKYNGNTGTSLE
jgi:hypothetical protein